jgi:hypothetical protein
LAQSAIVFALIACALGAGMGAFSLANPAWGARLVRLIADPDRPGGFAEFRASYGGLFLAGHVAAAAALSMSPESGAWACFALGAGWFGAGVGRTVSIFLDAGTATKFNWGSVVFEILMALALIAPVIVQTSPR